MLGGLARQAIRERSRDPMFRSIASICEKYLRAYNNEDFYDYRKNGEAFLLETVASLFSDLVIWDVGAHRGSWAVNARRLFPHASIHCFEIVPSIADELEQRVGSDPLTTVHRIGLSEAEAEILVHVNAVHTTTNSIAPRAGGTYFGKDSDTVACKSSTCDKIAAEFGPPALLKIDTEGHEVGVLRGARELLASEESPIAIQFEYGETYIPSHATLKDVYDLLTPHGYEIGRLHPNHVRFKPYEYADDNFRMGNFVAVRDAAVRGRLEGRPYI
jgi:FkbM family methyltransferase